MVYRDFAYGIRSDIYVPYLTVLLIMCLAFFLPMFRPYGTMIFHKEGQIQKFEAQIVTHLEVWGHNENCPARDNIWVEKKCKPSFFCVP